MATDQQSPDTAAKSRRVAALLLVLGVTVGCAVQVAGRPQVGSVGPIGPPSTALTSTVLTSTAPTSTASTASVPAPSVPTPRPPTSAQPATSAIERTSSRAGGVTPPSGYTPGSVTPPSGYTPGNVTPPSGYTPGTVTPPSGYHPDSVGPPVSSAAAPTTSDRQPVAELADHPLLQHPDAGLQNVACDLPPWSSDTAAVQRFFSVARDCLDQAWEPLMTHYRLPFRSPKVEIPTAATYQTDCGTASVDITTAASYCNDVIYMPYAGLQTDRNGDNPGVYLAVFAHEYGHHIQFLSGIGPESWNQQSAAGPESPAGQELSRRLELQAQCFSGLYFGATLDHGDMTPEIYNAARVDQPLRGDTSSETSDHGSNVHYGQWWDSGATTNRIVGCNTYAAASEDVS